MTVTKESEGRLNVFAKEPEIELIGPNNSTNKASQRLLLFGGILSIGIIGFYLIFK